MEKLEIESSLGKTTKAEVMKIESSEVLPTSIATTCLRKIKPRAIIFKANDKDFNKLNDFIKSQFPEVEIVYVTTGPVAVFFGLPNQYLLNCRILLYTQITLLSSWRLLCGFCRFGKGKQSRELKSLFSLKIKECKEELWLC